MASHSGPKQTQICHKCFCCLKVARMLLTPHTKYSRSTSI